MRFVTLIVASAIAALAIPLAAQQNLPLSPPASIERPPADQARPTVPVTAPGANGAVPLEAGDLNAFLDGLVPQAIAGGDIAGGVVVVVKDGQILAQRGYGYSDVEAKTPVDPRRTLFRPGSVSKLFTWTAVMQQVERGRLDLDSDVNRYLDFKIPDHDGKPVTLRQIMKHTAGFEEQAKGIISFKGEDVRSFEQLLKQWVPERVFAPGSTPAYSNYATSLAGYIVQRVSGQPFDDYIERNIFKPLNMTNSTFRQPLPERFAPMMSKGYKQGSGKPTGFEFVGPAPAGSLSATGEDMARFMIAHLQNGGAILQPRTAHLMHRGATTRPIPGLNGMELGFYESDINGREVISHGGDTVAFHSTLHLFPGEGVGIFASFNSSGRNGAVSDLRSALFQRFAGRYFPGPKDNRRVDPQTAADHARMMQGVFANSRGSQSSFLNLGSLLGQVKVGVGKDGELVLPFANGFNGQPRRWVEIEPFVWSDLDSHERLAAVVENGKVVRFSLSSLAPIMVFDRVPWYKSSAWLVPLVVAGFIALLLTALVWPAAALVRRRYGAKLGLEGRELRVYRLSRIAAAVTVATLVGWFLVIGVLLGDIANLNASMDPLLWFLQILSLIAFVGGLAAMLLNLWTVWTGKRRWPARVWSLVLVVASAAMLWLAIAFNLIAMTVNY